MRSVLLLALTAACGAGDGRDAGPAGDGGSTASPELPAESIDPVSIEQLDELRYIISSDVLVQLGIERAAGMVTVAKQGKGYAIKKLAATSVVARLGLAEGDVIIGVNNVEMTNPSRLSRAWNRARKDLQVKLLVERSGAVIELRWLFERGVEDQVKSFRSTLGDRDRSTAEYAAVVDMARETLTGNGIHRYKIDRAVLAAMRDHPRLGDRRVASVWTARGSRRGVTVGVKSIYAAFGIGRFDIVKGVGADDVRTSKDLQRLLANQADAGEFTLSLVRLDEPVILRFTVIDGAIDASLWNRALEAWKVRDAEEDRDRFGGGSSLPFSSTAPPPKPITGIVKIDETNYEIKRRHLELFDFMRNSSGSSRHSMRIVPSIKNGKPNGFKLYAIRPSSGYTQLGFRNGDTVHRINKVSLTLDRLLRVAKSLERVKRFDVEISRRGKPMTLRYRVK